jgi:hypothetical protein
MNIEAVQQNAEPNREEVSDGWKLFFITYALHQLFWEPNQEEEIGGTCSIHGTDEK